jgi:chromate transporter
VAWLFLKLGTTAFGGPAAHVALLEHEVVRRRQWLSHEEFLDLLGATNLIPGPNSTEMAIHIGHRRAGWAGLVVAGCCFIFPAALIVTGFAWIYVQYRQLPQLEGLLYGIKPVVIAIVLQALFGLGRAALKTKTLAAAAVAAATLSFVGVNELIILFSAGSLFAIGQEWTRRRHQGAHWNLLLGLAPGLPLASASVGSTTAAAVSFGLWPLFLFFFKVGSVLFGSGYVLLAFLRADLVDRWQWLTEGQLLDAVAVGQVTPGPLFTTATFIGYVKGGLAGALVGTVGIFLPAFFFVAISGPLVPRLRKSPLTGAFLDGVVAASLALMAVVSWHLGRAALIDLPTWGLAVVSAFLLFRYRLNSIWLIAGGAAVGLILSWSQ